MRRDRAGHSADHLPGLKAAVLPNLLDRIARIILALLALKELEYFGRTQSGSAQQRQGSVTTSACDSETKRCASHKVTCRLPS